MFHVHADIGDLVVSLPASSVYPPVERFQCAVCAKVFTDKSNCRRHIKSTHFEEAQVSCSGCGKVFKNKRYARDHYTRCTGLISTWIKLKYSTFVSSSLLLQMYAFQALNQWLVSLVLHSSIVVFVELSSRRDLIA